MTFLSALLYSLVGILVVFFALVLLMGIIIFMTSPIFSRKAEETPAAPPAPAAPEKTKTPAPGTAGEVKLYDTEPRDAAMIMAIVAEELQTPLNELRFISIKKVDGNED